MFKRAQFKELFSRILEPRDKIQVISGPRQVGKSTLVKQVLQETSVPHLLVSADNVEETNNTWIGEMWATARARMKAGKMDEYLLVIDEVHKLDNWSEAVKKEWDEDTFNDLNLKVVILGSSRLLLKDGLTESLAGRYELIRLPHWSYAEMYEAFNMDVDHFIYFGGYPGGAKYINDERRWRRYIKDSIIAPAIERDVLQTKTIYKPALMKQMFELGCTYSSEECRMQVMLQHWQVTFRPLMNRDCYVAYRNMLPTMHENTTLSLNLWSITPHCSLHSQAQLSTRHLPRPNSGGDGWRVPLVPIC